MPPISCPACQSELDLARLTGNEVLEPLISCAHCLTIVKVTRNPHTPPHAVVAGSVVARSIERLDRADGEGRLAEEIAELAAAEETRMSLRVPEVFRIAGQAFGSRVRFREPAGFFSFQNAPPRERNADRSKLPTGRITVDRFNFQFGNAILKAAAEVARNGGVIEPRQTRMPGFFGIAPGYEFEVLERTAAVFLLAAPPPMRPGSPWGWPAFEGFLTPLDLLEPAG
jgi:hypothetical protein